jgi:hypothetical protein
MKKKKILERYTKVDIRLLNISHNTFFFFRQARERTSLQQVLFHILITKKRRRKMNRPHTIQKKNNYHIYIYKHIIKSKDK